MGCPRLKKRDPKQFAGQALCLLPIENIELTFTLRMQMKSCKPSCRVIAISCQISQLFTIEYVMQFCLKLKNQIALHYDLAYTSAA